MKDYHFHISVADILHDSAQSDSIYFTHKFSTLLPQLTEKGISATITLEGMDHNSLLVIVDQANAAQKVICDKCGKQFTQELEVANISAKCFFEEESAEQKQDGDILFFKKGTHTIDLEKFLVNSLLLTLPVTNVCNECGKLTPLDSEENKGPTNTIKWT